MVKTMTTAKVSPPIACVAVTASGTPYPWCTLPFPYGNFMSPVHSTLWRRVASELRKSPLEQMNHDAHAHIFPCLHCRDEDPLDSYKYRIGWVVVLPTPYLTRLRFKPRPLSPEPPASDDQNHDSTSPTLPTSHRFRTEVSRN